MQGARVPSPFFGHQAGWLLEHALLRHDSMLPFTARGAVRSFLFLVLGMLLAGRAEAPGAPGLLPSPPPEYKVTIRYRIRAGANQRVAQFLAMTRYLES